MKIVQREYRITNNVTGEIKILNSDKIVWYELRIKYSVEPVPIKSKIVQDFTNIFNSPPDKIGEVVTIGVF